MGSFLALVMVYVVFAFVCSVLKKKRKQGGKPITSKKTAMIDKPEALESPIEMTVTSSYNEESIVDIKNLSCNCYSFKNNRTKFDKTDPRRLCNHLVKAVNSDINLMKSFAAYKEQLQWHEGNKKGFRPITHRVSTVIGLNKIEAFADSYDEETIEGYWVNLAINGKHYGYSPESAYWARGLKPENVEKIEEWIASLLPKFSPAVMKERIRTTYRNSGKKTYSVKGEVLRKIIWMYVQPGEAFISVKIGNIICLVDKASLNFKEKIPRVAYMEKALLLWIDEEYKKIKKL